MTQRLRNIQQALGSKFPAAQVVGEKQAFGYTMASYKAAQQSVTSSTTFVNDDSLWTELPAGPNRMTFFLPVSMAAAGNIKLQMVADQGLVTSSIRMSAVFLADGIAPSVQAISALSTPINGGATTAWTGILIIGTVNVTNQGVLQLQWSQNASNATLTGVLGGASLDTTPLG